MFYKARGVNLKETAIKPKRELYQPYQGLPPEELGGHRVRYDIFEISYVIYVNST